MRSTMFTECFSIIKKFWGLSEMGVILLDMRTSCKQNIFKFEREIFEKIEIFDFLHAKSRLLAVFFLI